MTMIERIKNILITPKTEWPVIAGETTANIDLVKGYVLPLAAIPAVAGFVGGSLIGHSVAFLGGTYRVPFMAGLGFAIFGFVMAIVAVYLMAFIVNALAPTFGAAKNAPQAFKVVVYSSTAGWLGGIFHMLPGLGLLALLASLYGIYILYLGLPKLMKCPEDKAIGYTAVVVVVAIVVFAIVGVLVGVVGGIGGAATGLFGSHGGQRRGVGRGRPSRLSSRHDDSQVLVRQPLPKRTSKCFSPCSGRMPTRPSVTACLPAVHFHSDSRRDRIWAPCYSHT